MTAERDTRPGRYTLHVHLPDQAPTRFTCVCRCGWVSDFVGSAAVAQSLWDRHVAGGCPEFPDLEVTR